MVKGALDVLKDFYKEYDDDLRKQEALRIKNNLNEYKQRSINIVLEEYKLRCNDFRAEYNQYSQLWAIFLSVIGIIMGLALKYENGQLSPTPFILSIPYFALVFFIFLAFRRKTSVQLQEYIHFLEKEINRILIQNGQQSLLLWFWLIREKFKQSIRSKWPTTPMVWFMVLSLGFVCLALLAVSTIYAFLLIQNKLVLMFYFAILVILLAICFWSVFSTATELPIEHISKKLSTDE